MMRIFRVVLWVWHHSGLGFIFVSVCRGFYLFIRKLFTAPHRAAYQRFSWYRRWNNVTVLSRLHIPLFPLAAVISTTLVGVFFMSVNALPDITDVWDFSDNSDYAVSDGVEVVDSAAKLKFNEYAADSETVGLYHFNEINGSTASDSSSYANSATVFDSVFDGGILSNSLRLDGSLSRAVVPSSPSLKLTRDNTIEAWTKFDNSFSTSAVRRQGIVDKGDYQMYFNNETGKLTYELADKNASGWTQAGGNNVNSSWDQSGNRSVNAQVKIGTDIFVGIGTDIGDAEVWKWSGTNWSKIGGGTPAINGSWDANTYEGVYSLATDGTNLYAGLGTGTGEGEVWMWNGTAWAKIGGDSVNGGWTNYAEQVWMLDYFGGNLYAGLGNTAGDAEIWRWNGTAWTKIGGDNINAGWTTVYEAVTGLTNDGTNLYAGLGSTAGDSEVWMWNGSSWSKIGGDSVNGGWDTTIETVRSLKHFGGNLYAGLGDTAGDAEVWRWNGSAWTKIGGDAVSGSWANATYEQVTAFAWDGTNLYAGLGTSNGDGEVWRWNGSAWTKIGGDALSGSWTANQGDAVNSLLFNDGKLYTGTYDAAGDGLFYSFNGTSWTQLGGAYVNESWGMYGVGSMQVMQAQGGYLYAGTGTAAGNALVYRFDGTSWELVGGQGVNSSWSPFARSVVYSMASFQGNLYVGLGNGANNAELWRWDGNSWTIIAGNTVGSSWGSNYEEVDALATDGQYLYAGLGNSAQDGDVWRYDGSAWQKIGGDSLNGGWTTGNNIYNIYSLAVYKGKLIAGLGRTAGQGQAWSWNGSAWTKIGGNGVNGSWDSAGNNTESVESLITYNGRLYAGLGATTGDGAVWEYDDASWQKVGGDELNGSWVSGTYERVKTLSVYNGDLYAGLGSTASRGEVWRYRSGVWERIGGNGINSGWSNAIEEIGSFSAYKGKFYVGLGTTAAADAQVWSWGNNAFLESNTSSWDNDWHHVAASYDGSTMKLYVDGSEDGSRTVAVQIAENDRSLLIGDTYGGREYGKPSGNFDGLIDELRISNVARTAFNTEPFSDDAETVQPVAAIRKDGIWHWDEFSHITSGGGTVKYRLSDDDGASWKYWDGTTWTVSSDLGMTNTASEVDDNIADFPVTFGGLLWQGVLQGDGNQRVTLSNVTVKSTSDDTLPDTSGLAITAKKAHGGATLTDSAWTNGSSPEFNWSGASDGDSGLAGYCLYIGTDQTANPTTTKGMLGTSPVLTGDKCQYIVSASTLDLSSPGALASALTSSNDFYYLRVSAIDKAGNISTDIKTFSFKFDNTAPSTPGFISAPSGFVSNKAVTLSWPTTGGDAPADANSGLAGLQYRIGPSGTWYGAAHAGTGDQTDLLTNSGSYTMQDPPDFANLVDGINTVYFRTFDTAGNISTGFATAAIKLNTSGAPSEPLSISASPSTNSTNSFSFSWSPPNTFVGDVNNLTYCYTVNVAPNAGNCSYTGAGNTSLPSGAYATQPGINTLYLAAKDESGSINYSNYGTAEFTANTTAPGLPLNADIADVSIKSTNKWRLALTWDEPTSQGSGVAKYDIYRSTDDDQYSYVGTSSSTTYIDAGLQQITYHYKVKACDNTNNCGAYSSSVSYLPTGRFTDPAALVAEPEVSDITTRKATIRWSTDRASDSKIAIGTTSGQYGSSEVSNSDQVSAHEVNLDNLAAGTTYYYVARWTDEDGNTGNSQEFTFRTAPPPTLKEITATLVGLDGVTIQFISKNATKVDVLFGPSESFGGIKTINTSLEESAYTVNLDALTDGTKYFYKIVSYDKEGSKYDGSTQSFTTPPKPRISEMKFQPIPGKPTSTQQVTWRTNVPSTTRVVYGLLGSGGEEKTVPGMTTEHTIEINDLIDDSQYFIVAQSRDANGNLAVSDRQVFKTAEDTRQPTIDNVSIQTSIDGAGSSARGRVVVSWRTDEPATSQVAYEQGSDKTIFSTKTPEDTGLSFEHVVIVTDLPTSRVYSIKPISYDKSRNESDGSVESAIVGRASDDILTIVLNSLKGVFGF